MQVYLGQWHVWLGTQNGRACVADGGTTGLDDPWWWTPGGEEACGGACAVMRVGDKGLSE